MKIVIILVSFIIGTVPIHGGAHSRKNIPQPFVKLANGGLVSGSVEISRDGRPYEAYTGIPYATVPERFQEPQPIVIPSWKGAFNATKQGPLCSQILTLGNDQVIHSGEEDCLNLNVYVPMKTSGPDKNGYPVMVWVHGGAFMSGGGIMHGPQYFMDENVVLVTINYRLGVFGFLSTGDSVVPGNNGLKDMVMALRWVQDNIGVFGGNPSLVTIFGESAGAAAIHYLMLSPTTKGLFHRAISQSGTALELWAYEPNPKQVAVELATFLKCPTTAPQPSDITSEEILTCLKDIPADELNRAHFAFTKQCWPCDLRVMFFVPTSEPVDPVSSLTPFITASPLSLVSARESNMAQIPLMVGANEDEGTLTSGPILAKSERLNELNTNWEQVAPLTFNYWKFVLKKELQLQVSRKLRDFYFGDRPISEETRTAITNVYTDGNNIHAVYRTAMDTAARGEQHPVYYYQYAHKGPISFMAKLLQFGGEEAEMVGHGDELVHLFDVDAFFPGEELIKPGSPDEEFSKNLVRLWASFALHGKPMHSWGTVPLPTWERVSEREALGLDATRWFRIDSNPSYSRTPHSIVERLTFWDDLWYEYIIPILVLK